MNKNKVLILGGYGNFGKKNYSWPNCAKRCPALRGNGEFGRIFGRVKKFAVSTYKEIY